MQSGGRVLARYVQSLRAEPENCGWGWSKARHRLVSMIQPLEGLLFAQLQTQDLPFIPALVKALQEPHGLGVPSTGPCGSGFQVLSDEGPVCLSSFSPSRCPSELCTLATSDTQMAPLETSLAPFSPRLNKKLLPSRHSLLV